MNLNKKMIAITCSAISLIAAVGAIAYFSGKTDTKENVISIVTGEKNQENAGTIEEPSWNPDNAVDLQPGATVPKDPRITSNVEYDAWAFLKIEMPTISARQDGDEADFVYDAFTYKINNTDWVQLEMEDGGKSDVAGTDSVYLYAYKIPLPAGETSSALFTEMIVPNFIKTPGLSDSVDVTGYLVQIEGFESYLDAAKEIGGNGIVEIPDTNNSVITSNNENDVYGYIKVEVPTVSAKKPGDTENKVYDKYTFESNPSWEQIEMADGSGKSDVAGTDSEYVYGYTEVLSKGESSTELYDELIEEVFDSIEQDTDEEVTFSPIFVEVGEYEDHVDASVEIGGIGKEEEVTETTLKTGSEVNFILKNLSGHGSDEESNNTNIKQILRSNTAPEGDVISFNIAMDNEIPVTAWFEADGTGNDAEGYAYGNIYYYSEAEKIKFNANCAGMFDRFMALTSLDLSDIDVSEVTDMTNMFNRCESLTSIDITGWDSAKAENVVGLFAYCYKLTEIIGLKDLDMTNVTDLSGLFLECSSLENIDISNWNTENVSNMYGLFGKCVSLKNINGIEDLNTNNLKSLEGAFAYCSSLESLNLNSWNVSKVETLASTFFACSNLKTITINNWKPSSVTTMEKMFAECSSITSIDLSDWNTLSLTNMMGIFGSDTNLSSVDLSGWDTSEVTTMQALFGECSSLTEIIGIENFDTSKVANLSALFYNCSSLPVEFFSTLNNWNILAVKEFAQTCYGCQYAPNWNGTWSGDGTFAPT